MTETRTDEELAGAELTGDVSDETSDTGQPNEDAPQPGAVDPAEVVAPQLETGSAATSDDPDSDDSDRTPDVDPATAAAETGGEDIPSDADVPSDAGPLTVGATDAGTDAEAALPETKKDQVEAEIDEGGADDEAVAELDEDQPAEFYEDDQRIPPNERPGDWFVIHTYAGYENKVKANLKSRIQSMNVEDSVFEVVIPMEDVM